MKLEHYSSGPLKWPPRDYKQRGLGEDSNYKPLGFWVSVAGEYDWPSWCQAEEFGLDRLSRKHNVTLADDANVLVITSAEELRAFDDKYALPHPLIPTLHYKVIDWPRVAAEYDGIIIAPYRWESRLGDMFWYYGWDCASGCIWNAKAIASFEEVQQEEAVDG